VDLPQSFTVGAVRATRPDPRDSGDVFELHQDSVVMAGLGGVRDRERTNEYMEANLAHWERWGFGIYLLRDLRTGRHLGRAGLRHVEVAVKDEVEVAYALVCDPWGKGTATSIVRELVVLASRERLGESIVALPEASNRRSIRVMEKAGFSLERRLERNGRPYELYRHPLPRP
jgi:RimJ/RimL family protein N-acetyltransferase